MAAKRLKPLPPVNMNDATIYDLYPARFLKPHDIGETAQLVSINRVMKEDVWDKPTQQYEQIKILYFDQYEKGLKLPKTHGFMIAKMFGDRTKNWLGQTIRLVCVRETVAGETHYLVRISNEKIPQTQTPEPTTPTPPVPITEEQLELLEEIGVEMYDDEWVIKAAELAEAISEERTPLTEELTEVEGNTLLEGIKARLKVKEKEEWEEIEKSLREEGTGETVDFMEDEGEDGK